MRLRRVAWKLGVPFWHLQYGFSELMHKGARVEFGACGAWLVRW
jgi:hypothetical protein